MCDPNLERVDLFACPVQSVEDSLGVRERAIVAAAEAHDHEYLAEQVSGNRRSLHRVDLARSRFPDVGHAFAPA
jgi:hypothetical protein